MEDIYECSRCGVVARESGQLCHPRHLDEKNEYCGTSPERGALCGEAREHLPFVCSTCGRPAEQSDLVCDPLVVGGEPER